MLKSSVKQQPLSTSPRAMKADISSLNTKKVMTKMRKREVKADEKEASTVAKCSPKIASNLKEMKRTTLKRKTKEQIAELEVLYKKVKGIPPSLSWIEHFAKDIGLGSIVIYKWFWDRKKKEEADSMMARSVVLNHDDKVKDEGLSISGVDGSGNKLSRTKVRSALRAKKNEKDQEMLSF